MNQNSILSRPDHPPWGHAGPAAQIHTTTGHGPALKPGPGFQLMSWAGSLTGVSTWDCVLPDLSITSAIGSRDEASNHPEVLACGSNGYVQATTVRGAPAIIKRSYRPTGSAQVQDPTGLWKEMLILHAIAGEHATEGAQRLPCYLGSGSTREGEPFLLMGRVDGGSLGSPAHAGAQAPSAACSIGADLLSALAVLDRLGVIHQDIKRANVMLDREGRAVLIDFGAASGHHGVAALDFQTGNDIFTPGGTPAVHAPEYRFGDNSQIGPISDVWSVGLLLIDLLTGIPDIGGSLIGALDHTTPDEYQAALQAVLQLVVATLVERDALPQWAHRVAELLTAMLAFDPAQRIPAALAVEGWAHAARSFDTQSRPRYLDKPGVFQGWLIPVDPEKDISWVVCIKAPPEQMVGDRPLPGYWARQLLLIPHDQRQACWLEALSRLPHGARADCAIELECWCSQHPINGLDFSGIRAALNLPARLSRAQSAYLTQAFMLMPLLRALNSPPGVVPEAEFQRLFVETVKQHADDLSVKDVDALASTTAIAIVQRRGPAGGNPQEVLTLQRQFNQTALGTIPALAGCSLYNDPLEQTQGTCLAVIDHLLASAMVDHTLPAVRLNPVWRANARALGRLLDLRNLHPSQCPQRAKAIKVAFLQLLINAHVLGNEGPQRTYDRLHDSVRATFDLLGFPLEPVLNQPAPAEMNTNVTPLPTATPAVTEVVHSARAGDPVPPAVATGHSAPKRTADAAELPGHPASSGRGGHARRPVQRAAVPEQDQAQPPSAETPGTATPSKVRRSRRLKK